MNSDTQICFVADFFAEHVLGGGELNNEELIELLKAKGISVVKKRSFEVNQQYVKNSDEAFIIANFIGLSEESKFELQQKSRYIIYEHDHKYLTNRNPAHFKDFVAPKEAIINYEFYEKANAVFCQSEFHQKIIQKNLNLDNIENLSGNLWNVESLQLMREISHRTKKNSCSVMDSDIAHKNTAEAVKYCLFKNLKYQLISDSNYCSFLEKLGENDKFVFFPKTPETLSRVVVEARMMGLSVITNNLVGATHEPWFKQKGPELIDTIETKREEIPSKVLKAFE